MAGNPYNHQIISRYLLGALPGAESERLDEVSIGNDAVADALNIAEQELIDAYVQGELGGGDLDRFNHYYLASPLRREKVEFAQAFQAFGERESAGLEAEGPTKVAVKQRWFTALTMFLVTRPALQWGLTAAVLGLLIGGGWLVVDNLRLRRQLSQTGSRRDLLIQREQDLQKETEDQRAANSQAEQDLARVSDERERLEQELKTARPGGIKAPAGERSIVSLILAPPLRGATQVSTLSIMPGTNQVEAHLRLEAAEYSTFRVGLIDSASNRILWRSGNLKLNTRGQQKTISVSFPTRLLKPQNYTLRLSGVATGGAIEIVSDYPFRVAK